MRKAILLAVTAAGFTGCATPPSPIHLSDEQKHQVADGKSVMITESREDFNFQDMVEPVNKAHVKNGIYVCATSNNTPKDNTPCYPYLSRYIGNYFEKQGVKVSSSKNGADAIVYVSVTYDFVDVFPSDGNDYRGKIMDDLEESISQGIGAKLTMKQLPGEAFYKSDQASVDSANKRTKIEGTAKALGYRLLPLLPHLWDNQVGAHKQVKQFVALDSPEIQCIPEEWSIKMRKEF